MHLNKQIINIDSPEVGINPSYRLETKDIPYDLAVRNITDLHIEITNLVKQAGHFMKKPFADKDASL
jgi:hypothetical protein